MRVRLLESCSSALDGGQTAPSARISRDRAASKIKFRLHLPCRVPTQARFCVSGMRGLFNALRLQREPKLLKRRKSVCLSGVPPQARLCLRGNKGFPAALHPTAASRQIRVHRAAPLISGPSSTNVLGIICLRRMENLTEVLSDQSFALHPSYPAKCCLELCSSDVLIKESWQFETKCCVELRCSELVFWGVSTTPRCLSRNHVQAPLSQDGSFPLKANPWGPHPPYVAHANWALVTNGGETNPREKTTGNNVPLPGQGLWVTVPGPSVQVLHPT